MRPFLTTWALTSLPLLVSSQTFDLSSLLSEARSVYTEATSILGGGGASTSRNSLSSTTSGSSTSSSTSSHSTTTSSSSSTSTSSLTSSSSQSSSTSSPISTSATSSLPASTSAQQTAVSDAGANASSNHSTNVLAIVLGCTLGALALAAFLLLLCFFCRRRRRDKRSQSEHKSPRASDDASHVWQQHEKPKDDSFVQTRDITAPTGMSTAPLMTDHYEPYPGHHQNPFVPAPPPARRTGSRAEWDDHGMYSHIRPDHDPYHDSHPESHHAAHDLAAGAGGFALGGLAAHALHRHDRKRSTSADHVPLVAKDDESLGKSGRHVFPENTGSHRRSGSSNRVGKKEPWPFYDAQTRASNETSRSRRDSSSHGHDVFATPDETPWTAKPSMPSSNLRDAALGGLTGAGLAAATHGPKHRDPSSRRKGILKQTTSDNSEPSSLSRSSNSGVFGTDEHTPNPKAHGSGPHELGVGDILPNPTFKERPVSALGTAAPAAALGSVYMAEHPQHDSRRQSMENAVPPITIPRSSQDVDRTGSSPAVPSRSPHRSSLTPNARYSLDNNGTAEMPTESPRIRGLASAHPEMDMSRERDRAMSPVDMGTSREPDNAMSPVSPMTASQPGTLTASEIQALAAAGIGTGVGAAAGSAATRRMEDPRGISQESTVAGSRESPDKTHATDKENSGLLSAIQNIFSSQQKMWATDEETGRAGHHQSRNRFSWEDPEDEVPYEASPQAGPISRVASQKAVPTAQTLATRESQYGALDCISGSSSDEDHKRISTNMAAGIQTADYASQCNSQDYQRALPARYRDMKDRRHSADSTHNNELTTVSSNTSRGRGRGYSGYGIGSGDPFDLASTRTDSQMTGISLSNYREPTLAELKEQVKAEDRERERQSWSHSRSHSRSNSANLRYGDDRNLFDLESASQTVAAPGIDDYDAFYGGDGRYPRRKRASGGSVGRAY